MCTHPTLACLLPSDVAAIGGRASTRPEHRHAARPAETASAYSAVPAIMASTRDVEPDPRYGRNVTSRTVRAGRIPVTRLTPALPDPRWNPKAFGGEVVPFRATVFREGHDLVGAMLVVTSPTGIEHRERMYALAEGTDRWEARFRLDELGTWRWRVIGFGDEIATWVHDAELKIDAGVDVELMYEIGARLVDRAVADPMRPTAARTRLTAYAAALRDTDAAASDRRALLEDPVLDEFTMRPLARAIRCVSSFAPTSTMCA